MHLVRRGGLQGRATVVEGTGAGAAALRSSGCGALWWCRVGSTALGLAAGLLGWWWCGRGGVLATRQLQGKLSRAPTRRAPTYAGEVV